MFLLDVLTNAAMWAGIVGFLSPIVIQFLTARVASRQVQALLAFLFCLVVSAGTAYFTAAVTLHDVAKSMLIVFTLAIASYEHFWKPIGVTPSTSTVT